MDSLSPETSHPQTLLLADLAGQVVHQGHDGVLEERGCGTRSLGDLCDAQISIWPHLLYHGVGALKESRRRRTVRRGTSQMDGGVAVTC